MVRCRLSLTFPTSCGLSASNRQGEHLNCDGVRLPKKTASSSLVPISTVSVVALRDAMPAHMQAFVTVGAGTGMRRGELFGLTVDRVDFLRKEIAVDRQLAPGTGDTVKFAEPKSEASSRVIPVDDVVIEAIAAHLAAFPAHESGLDLHERDRDSAAAQHALDGLGQGGEGCRHHRDPARSEALLRVGADPRRTLDQGHSTAPRAQVRD
jgi:integrase